MTKKSVRKVTYDIDEKTIKELKATGIDAIKEITDAVQNDADKHGEEVEIIRGEENHEY